MASRVSVSSRQSLLIQADIDKAVIAGGGFDVTGGTGQVGGTGVQVEVQLDKVDWLAEPST